MIRRHVVVSGRVQGVFYRASLEQEAHAAGVAGWVRNRVDGTVEAVLEGERAAVERVLAWCRQGPARAEVADVVVEDEEPVGETGFTTRG
ncbi:acylphosphatase [Aeromicrobium sp. CnD17-E]|uniref:acylphosphatase n=1 Tax=Aeromicrobium sp. CnD17-E TaxID=2954487 RepID=UPI0020973E30|nr:acylphosphatase [Aeromicrobium sp. CnD17-E]MCO7239872.1 acylphosphatase [Aeromicrobium sp. CnD17-E]